MKISTERVAFALLLIGAIFAGTGWWAAGQANQRQEKEALLISDLSEALAELREPNVPANASEETERILSELSIQAVNRAVWEDRVFALFGIAGLFTIIGAIPFHNRIRIMLQSNRPS